jgi:choline dehydrogenase-like flavoprotein
LRLTARERATLRLVCDTFFPSLDAGSEFLRRAASDYGVDEVFAETVEAMPDTRAKDVALVLKVLDSRGYGLFFSRTKSRFSELDLDGRTKLLCRWRDSPLPIKRTAFQALKRLSCFLAYTVRDGSGTNPNWADIGYPAPSVTDRQRLPDSGRISPMDVTRDAVLTCDVCIVGSGAGGSVIAKELAADGFSILVLEEGSYETPETYDQDELGMMRKLFSEGGTASTADLSFTLLAGRGAGGGTAVNWNTCLEPPARVLREWETDFGVAGVTGPVFRSYLAEVWTSLKVNSEESQFNGNNRALWNGCKALGYAEGSDYHLISRNAVGCRERCDFCSYGCVYGCKQSTVMNYLPAAYRGGAKFLFDTKVDYVSIEGGVARGVRGTHRVGSETVKVDVRAKVVVAACGGIETPALLLRSGVRDREVGRHLRLDPTVAVGGVFDHVVAPWAGPPQTVAVWKHIDLDGGYHGFWVEAAPAHPGLFAFTIPWLDGMSHKLMMRDEYSRSASAIVLLRERSEGTVGIAKDGGPVVSYRLMKEDRETLETGMAEAAKILAAAGAKKVWTTHTRPVSVGDGSRLLDADDLCSFADQVRRSGTGSNRLMLFSAHLMGSCRMSSDPSRGPTSPSGEIHTVKNLYVGDACVFPTTPAVNPMISIMAMARRTAEFIKESLRR